MKQQLNFFQVIEDFRQLSFRICEHSQKLIKQQTAVAAITQQIQDVISLKTVYQEKSQKLSEDIQEMQALSKSNEI